jgi:hypothetical protein
MEATERRAAAVGQGVDRGRVWVGWVGWDGERRWEGHVRDSTETKLSMKYTTELGIHYSPSGCIETASGRLHVPWPLPARRIAFPHAVRAADSRAAARDSDTESEEDEAPEEDEEEEAEEPEQSTPAPRRVTRAVASVTAVSA